MVNIVRGQFVCGASGCVVAVRFDDGSFEWVSAEEPTDHDTTMLFLSEESRLVSRLRKSKRLRIEATFYREGNQTLDFDVSDFKWPARLAQ